jgi:hypothetical protein
MAPESPPVDQEPVTQVSTRCNSTKVRVNNAAESRLCAGILLEPDSRILNRAKVEAVKYIL